MLMETRGRELDMIMSATYQFRTMEDAHTLSLYLANAFPEPERVVNGLTELMFNAVEHGNLGIGYQMKAELSQQNMLATEVAQRLQSPVLGERVAEVTMTRKDGGIYIVISDQGEGFDWKEHLKINPSRAGKASGRGIAMANSISFDKLTYNDKGNTAVAFVAERSGFEW